jgi:hypothetical protein
MTNASVAPALWQSDLPVELTARLQKLWTNY